MEGSLWLPMMVPRFCFGFLLGTFTYERVRPDFRSLFSTFYTLIGFPALLKNCFYDAWCRGEHVKNVLDRTGCSLRLCCRQMIILDLPTYC
jgi:hypothetical protein